MLGIIVPGNDLKQNQLVSGLCYFRRPWLFSTQSNIKFEAGIFNPDILAVHYSMGIFNPDIVGSTIFDGDL